jgi:hypothetical protein
MKVNKNTEDNNTDKKLHISNVSYNDFTFYGKKISDLTRDELYKGIEWLYNENERYRKMYRTNQKDMVDLMGDMINMKKNQN